MAHYQETKEIQSLMADQLGITSEHLIIETNLNLDLTKLLHFPFNPHHLNWIGTPDAAMIQTTS